MDLEALGGWPGILAFLLVASCIALIFGLGAPRFGSSKTAGAATSLPDRVGQSSDRRPPAAALGFGEMARERLEPLLGNLVDRARAQGSEARLELTGEGRASTYRLEIRRPDHPAGQPPPYIAFSAGEDGLVEVIYGGVYPGPVDHNRHDTEIGWRTVRWDQVDHLLAIFAHKVFARFD
ncbi:hypothetical protein [Caulobacter segnis]|nr:hypothetical protein [Caulobacter segnis]